MSDQMKIYNEMYERYLARLEEIINQLVKSSREAEALKEKTLMYGALDYMLYSSFIDGDTYMALGDKVWDSYEAAYNRIIADSSPDTSDLPFA